MINMHELFFLSFLSLFFTLEWLFSNPSRSGSGEQLWVGELCYEVVCRVRVLLLSPLVAVDVLLFLFNTSFSFPLSQVLFCPEHLDALFAGSSGIQSTHI